MFSHESLLVGTNVLLVVVTALMAWSVWLQVRQLRRQTDIAQAGELREVERGTPNVKVIRATELIRTGVGEYEHREGMTITNVGTPDTIIRYAGVVPARLESEGSGRTELSFPSPSFSYGGTTTCNSPLPICLKSGESLSITFKRDDLIERLREAYRPVRRVRFECQDTLGNNYTSGFWIEFDEDSQEDAMYDDPGPGMVEPTL